MTSTVLWTLIAIQIAMGAFDTLYHHELTERLPWRTSQQHELALHAVRNMLYAALFLVLGFFETHGVWALLVVAVLAIEVVITLMDFVEEDLSRKLPASERINHTLLALNYGAILALLLPVLIHWSRQPAAIVPVTYGYWSGLAALTALGVLLFGLRDFAASRRARRLVPGEPAALMAALPGRQHVLVTGATGFVGQRLVDALSATGHYVIVLARDPVKAAALRPPFHLVTDLDQIATDVRIDAIVNLAGEPLANGLWTRAKRFRIVASRLRMARAILRLIGRLEHRPSVLISGVRGRLVRAVERRRADGVRRRQAIVLAPHLRHGRARGETRRTARRPHGSPTHRPRARNRGRAAGPHAHAIRVRHRRPHRQRPAMDVVDCTRRSGTADRAYDRNTGTGRRCQRNRPGAGAQFRLHGRAWPRAPSPGHSADAGWHPAPARRRSRRRTAARRSAGAARQGLDLTVCVSPPNSAQRTRINAGTRYSLRSSSRKRGPRSQLPDARLLRSRLRGKSGDRACVNSDGITPPAPLRRTA